MDRCNFEKGAEINFMFNKILLESCFKNNLRYLTIQRCKVAKNFLKPYLTTFLSYNESLVRLSLVQNSFYPEPLNSKKDEHKISLRASYAPGAPSEEDNCDAGLKDDLEIYEILDCATLHPNMEII